MTLAWMLNRKSSVEFIKQGVEVEPIRNAVLVLEKLPPGAARIEWWDTRHGEVMATREAAVDAEGVLRIFVPDFERDAACKVLHADCPRADATPRYRDKD